MYLDSAIVCLRTQYVEIHHDLEPFASSADNTEIGVNGNHSFRQLIVS